MAAVAAQAVRMASPEPAPDSDPRKRAPSRSLSPRRDAPPLRWRSSSPPRARSPPRQREALPHDAAAKAEYDRLLTIRSGGTYIPAARLKALQAQITDKSSKEYQRMAWEALKKSINGLINKVNVSNIKFIVPELAW
nr:Pre-mRNA-splicing factor cwc22 [Rachicladosporium sp. CCFEE 5018]